MAKIYQKARICERTELIIGDNSIIQDDVFVSVPLLIIGENSHINMGTKIIGKGNVFIGNNVAVTYNVLLITSTDQPSGKYMSDCRDEDERDILTDDIDIHNGSYIGSGVIIMPGVTIGSNVVIGANAYIDKHIGDNMIVIPKQELLVRKRVT